MKTALRLTITIGLAVFFSASSVQAQFNYETKDGTITITKYTGPGGGVTIPETINGLPVTGIGPAAFGGCTSLVNVIIPDCVVRIEGGLYSGAFAGCTGLTNIIIGHGVTRIGFDAFNSCTELVSVRFTGDAPSLGPCAFEFDDKATIYWLAGTTGWGPTFGNRPTAQWLLPYPVILTATPTFGIKSHGFGFTVSWATNTYVVVESSSNLKDPVWSPVVTNLLTDGVFNYSSDPQWKAHPQRFYRIRSRRSTPPRACVCAGS